MKDQDLDKVYYEVKLYSSEDKAQLLSINIPGRDLKTGSQSVAVTTEDNATKDYTFPVEYDRTNKRATLVLDGMMNAKLYDRLDKLSADNKAAFRQSSDTSITRFGGKLETPLNVYAAVQVFPDPNAENTRGEEYQKSDAIDPIRRTRFSVTAPGRITAGARSKPSVICPISVIWIRRRHLPLPRVRWTG